MTSEYEMENIEVNRRLRVILDSIADGFYSLDTEFRFTHINDAALSYFKKDREEMIGKHIFDVFPSFEGSVFDTVYRRAIDSAEPAHLEAPSVVNDRTVEIHVYPGPNNLTVLFRDITEHRRMEENSARLAAIVESSDDAIIGKTLDGEIVSWNRAAEKIYGYTAEEAIGQSIYILVPKDSRDELSEILQKISRSEVVDSYEARRVRKDGEAIQVSISISPIKDTSGNTIGASTIARDITRRKQMEEELRESQSHLDLALRSAQMGVWDLDLIENKRHFDDQVCHLLGIDPAKFTGTAEEFFKAVHPDDREMLKAVLARTIEQDVPYETEYRAVWPDGSIHYIIARAKLFRNEIGQPVRVNGLIWDVTERKQTEEELHESQRKNEFLADIIRIGSQAFVVGYPDGRLGLVNSAFEHLTGYSSDELQSIDWATDLTPPEWLPFERQKLEEQILTGKPIRYEKEYIRKDGSRVPIELLVHLVTDSDGKPQYYYSFLTDITERKRAEEALREAKNEAERYGAEMATLMDALPAAVFIAHDVECRYMSGSRFTQELLGLPATANFSKSAPPPERPAHFRPMKDGLEIPPDELPVQMAAKGREIRDYEFELLFDDGKSRHLLGNATPLRNAGGQIYGSVGAFVDMTGRKRAEEELHKAKEEAEKRAKELEALMDAVPALIWVTRDTECLSMTGNRAVYEFLGMPAGANVSKTAPETERPVHFRALRNGMEILLDELPMQRAAKGEGMQDYELEYAFDDGTSKITLGNTTPLYDAAGHVYGAIAAFVDITERKQIEEELRKSRDELELRVHERTTEIKTYMKKLEQSNQALQDFASIASHDLQEPLRKVKAFGDMLKQKCAGSLEDQGRDYLERILNANQRMQSLLNGLLDYSRVTTKTEPFKEVDLSDLIDEVISDLEVRIVRTGGEVHVETLPVISADPTQMRQLFQNLIGNALKFHKPDEKPRVQVRCLSSNDSGCEIIVEDNGIGFEEKFSDKIFAPFQRLHGRSSQYEGTGMGLAICKKIVERHGGSITAKSLLDVGSTFIIELPVKNTSRTES